MLRKEIILIYNFLPLKKFNQLDRQITDTIMMVRPMNFGFNAETAKSNAFQTNSANENKQSIAKSAIEEFDNFVLKLKELGIKVIVMHETHQDASPDSIFPNNWISFHSNGTLITYPMLSPVRRTERREDFIDSIALQHDIKNRYSFEFYEEENKFLEGTGSMLLDRENKIVYACLSPRTNIFILDKFCLLMGYQLVSFTAVDKKGKEIYHTNVIMAIGEEYAVLCTECIKDEEQQAKVLKSLHRTDKKVIDITLDQVYHFAGNMLQVRGREGKPYLILSQQAYDCLTETQKAELSSFNTLVPIPIPTIEKFGGGSVRCMMAEVFLPKA